MVEGGMSVVKFLLFAFNFVFVICGIALIAVGGLAYSSGREYTIFLDTKFLTAPTIVIIVGCIIFFIAFLGCCGALRQNHCMVMTFTILLLIIFIIEIAGGITAYVYKGQVDQFLETNMNKTLKGGDDFKKIWAEMEKKWHCCGVHSAKDYGTDTVPKECCPESADDCTVLKAYDRGCYEELKERFSSKIATVGGIGIGIAFVEILGMIFGWCLASAIKKGYDGV